MVKVLLAAHGAVVEAHPAPATARELRAFAARQLGLDASEVLVLTPRATVLLDGHNVEEEAVYALAPAAAPPALWQEIVAALPDLDPQNTKNSEKPTAPTWEHADKCYICNGVFTWSWPVGSLPRHHCRACGRSVCDAHSGHSLALPQFGASYEAPQRVCDTCYAALPHDDGSRLAANARQATDIVTRVTDEIKFALRLDEAIAMYFAATNAMAEFLQTKSRTLGSARVELDIAFKSLSAKVKFLSEAAAQDASPLCAPGHGDVNAIVVDQVQ